MASARHHLRPSRSAGARAVHVIGFGWSGSSAAYEFLLEHDGVVAAGDGETCTMTKLCNPKYFTRIRPDVPMRRDDALHLLTGGRHGGDGAEESGGPAIHPDVRSFVAAHPRYAGVNKRIFPGTETSIEDVDGDTAAAWPNARTKEVLHRMASRAAPGYRYLLFDNDPTVPLIDASDLRSDDVFILVVRGARSQFADFVDRQLIGKYGKRLTAKKCRKWVLRQVRHRIHAIRVALGARWSRGTVLRIRFEDFVTRPDLRRAIEEILELEPLQQPIFDADASRRNLDVRTAVRAPWWMPIAFALLDGRLMRPRTRLGGS